MVFQGSWRKIFLTLLQNELSTCNQRLSVWNVGVSRYELDAEKRFVVAYNPDFIRSYLGIQDIFLTPPQRSFNTTDFK